MFGRFRWLDVEFFDHYIVGQVRFLCRVGCHRFRRKGGLGGQLRPAGLDLAPKCILLLIAQVQLLGPAVIQRHHFKSIRICCVFDGFAPVVKLHRSGQHILQLFQLRARHLLPDIVLLALDGKAFAIIVLGDGVDQRVRHPR